MTPAQCKDICPLIETSDLRGGLFIPSDGVADPLKLSQTFISEAIRMGVTVVENCNVEKIEQVDYKVKSVRTSSGPIECLYFVNASGFFARNVGQLSEPHVKVPQHAVEHYSCHIRPDAGTVDPNMPVVRDLDGQIYIREFNGNLMAGGFELRATPAYDDGILPESMMNRKLPPDYDHFHVLLQEILKRVPSLSKAVLEKLLNIPEAFSPDCKVVYFKSFLLPFLINPILVDHWGGP